jgi:hypothetical protein
MARFAGLGIGGGEALARPPDAAWPMPGPRMSCARHLPGRAAFPGRKWRWLFFDSSKIWFPVRGLMISRMRSIVVLLCSGPGAAAETAGPLSARNVMAWRGSLNN